MNRLFGRQQVWHRFDEVLLECQRTENLDLIFDEDWSEIPELAFFLEKIKAMDDRESFSELKSRQAEFLALQNQINPHFLYNTLEAIRGDAIGAGMNDIADTTKALATFFRYTITEVKKLVTLEDELDNVENYFIVQKYRFGDKIALKTEFLDDEMDLIRAGMPKLVLQPIVENAIAHGLEGKLGKGTVTIAIDHTDSELLITVRDDGIGMPQEAVERLNDTFREQSINPVSSKTPKRGHIALSNVNSRIKLLFGANYGIHILSVEKLGTEVQITLPYVTGDEIISTGTE